MSMEFPMSGRVPAVVGEVGNARQLPDRNARSGTKKSPPSGHSAEPQASDPSEPAVDPAEIDTGDTGDLSLATANGLTLTDVKAAYDSN
jgi:hypothetical protein